MLIGLFGYCLKMRPNLHNCILALHPDLSFYHEIYISAFEVAINKVTQGTFCDSLALTKWTGVITTIMRVLVPHMHQLTLKFSLDLVSHPSQPLENRK
jgi:hypothetical protein